MWTTFGYGTLLILLLVTLLWWRSVQIKNVSIVDIFWGMGFVVLNVFYALQTEPLYTRQILLLILVSIWGLRLSIYLWMRNHGQPEDYRYQEFRQRYGPQRYWWFSFFQVFLLQGGLMLLIAFPLLGIHTNTATDIITPLDGMAVLCWGVGFVFESVGDYQLMRFKQRPENKGKVLNTGLWRYTRHPNYFGDAMVWLAYGLFAVASGAYWQFIGTVLMWFLIIKVSGVAMLEEGIAERRPEYADYIKRTSAFFPWKPKRKL